MRFRFLEGAETLDGGLISIYLFALGVAYQSGATALRMAACAIVVATGLFGWTRAYRRARRVRDLPTSRIASAPQGYVELHGTAETGEAPILVSKLGAHPCVWYRFKVERQEDGKYRPVDSGESDAAFTLRDGSGTCIVDPAGATVVPARRRTWRDGDYRYTESHIAPGEPLYALGSFRTLSPVGDALQVKEEIGALLASWKRDRPALLRRFDENRDGELDLREWERARELARETVMQSQRERSTVPGAHMLDRPRDGRPYLLSTREPEALERYLGRWSWLHLAVALASVTGLAYLTLARAAS